VRRILKRTGRAPILELVETFRDPDRRVLRGQVRIEIFKDIDRPGAVAWALHESE
jgi:hypothetical protein